MLGNLGDDDTPAYQVLETYTGQQLEHKAYEPLFACSKAVADFSIPYETDLEKLEQKIPGLLEEIYGKHPELFKSVPKYLGVQTLNSSSVDLRFVAEVGEADIYAGARVLNHDLFVGFRGLGVECPFPQVDVHNK